MMSLQQQGKKPVSIKMYATTELNKPFDLLTGAGIAVLWSLVPFAVSFCLAHANGLTAGNYPSLESTAAATGLALCFLSVPIALKVIRCSVRTMTVTCVVMFWFLGLITALTV